MNRFFVPFQTLFFSLVCVTALSLSLVSHAFGQDVVNVYSYRNPELMAPLYEKFTAQTGIRVQHIFAKTGLIERIKAAGKHTDADVLLTTDVYNLIAARKADITEPVEDQPFVSRVEPRLKDPDGHWFALSQRARLIYASADRFKNTSISYEDLADPAFKGRVCTRSGHHSYTLGLIASMIAHHGVDETKTWLEGVKNNLARKPAGGDRDQAQAIFSGVCDVALGNSYYVILMKNNDKEPEQEDWFHSLRILFPNAGDRGTHVNISGMSLIRNAPHKDQALKLMSFLLSDEAQRVYASAVYEYPVVDGVGLSADVQALGNPFFDSLPLADFAQHYQEAARLVDVVGFDQ